MTSKMNLVVSLLISTLLLSFVKLQEVIHPSLRYGLNNEQMKDIELIIISQFLNNKEIPIDDIKIKEKIDFLGTVELNITEIIFKFVNLTESALSIHFEEENKVRVVLKEVKAILDFKYNFQSNFYSNDGKGAAKLNNATLTLVNSLVSIKNQKEPQKKGPGIQIESLDISSADFTFEFEHAGPLEKIIQFVIINLKDALVEVIQKRFNEHYRPIFNKELEDYLSQIDLSFPIINTNLTVSYSMNENPHITNTNLEMSFEAEIYSEKYKYPGKTYEIPHVIKSDSTIDLVISQFLIDNYVYITYKEGNLDFTIKSETTTPMDLTVALFTSIFPGLKDKYETTQLIDLKLKAYDSPFVEFVEEKAVITLKHNMEVYVRKDETTSELAVGGDTIMEAEIKFSITKGEIKGEIVKLVMTQFKKTVSNIGEIDESQVVKSTNDLIDLLLPFLNISLQKSLSSIKIPSIGNVQLDQTDIKIHKNYLAVGVSPYINDTLVHDYIH